MKIVVLVIVNEYDVVSQVKSFFEDYKLADFIIIGNKSTNPEIIALTGSYKNVIISRLDKKSNGHKELIKISQEYKPDLVIFDHIKSVIDRKHFRLVDFNMTEIIEVERRK